MSKYHIKKDGIPGICKAVTGKCPLGSSDEHYNTLQEALVGAASKLEKEFDPISTKKKDSIIYHVSKNGNFEECAYRPGMCDVTPFDRFGNYHSKDKDDVEIASNNIKRLIADEEIQERKIAAEREEQDRITTLAKEALHNRMYGPKKPKQGDMIFGRKIDNSVYSCSSLSYKDTKEFNSLREALAGGYSKEEIVIKTIDSCHHSSAKPDFSEENLDIDVRSDWKKKRDGVTVPTPKPITPKPSTTDSCWGGGRGPTRTYC